MNDDIKWIGGDGGPAIVLQITAAEKWQGATDFDNSLMNGGSIETDYDVICQGADSFSVIERYDRQMLVLADCSFGTFFAPSTNGEITIVLWYGSDRKPNEVIRETTVAAPSETFRFLMQDTMLRLLVGADKGNGQLYGFTDIPVTPGEKLGEVFYSDEAQIVVLRSAE